MAMIGLAHGSTLEEKNRVLFCELSCSSTSTDPAGNIEDSVLIMAHPSDNPVQLQPK